MNNPVMVLLRWSDEPEAALARSSRKHEWRYSRGRRRLEAAEAEILPAVWSTFGTLFDNAAVPSRVPRAVRIAHN
jgi:hypothetical protein